MLDPTIMLSSDSNSSCVMNPSPFTSYIRNATANQPIHYVNSVYTCLLYTSDAADE